jgi:TnsA endonuclease N terminal
MPVRKVPKNYLSVTGIFSSKKNAATPAFESILEKELMVLLEFDEEVAGFDEQPVRVPVPGQPRPYTPDIFIEYRTPPSGSETRKPSLAEVKHTDFLEKNADEYAPKFAAAEKYASDRGWEFKVITEKDIRIPRLYNLKFLKAYRENEVTPEECAQVINAVEALGGVISLQRLLTELANTDSAKLIWISIIWTMVCKKLLHLNLDEPFSSDPELWVE